MTVIPRPKAPPWRLIPGPTGTLFGEILRFLKAIEDREENWGNHVEVTFPAAGSIKVRTGLSGPATGYLIVKRSANIQIWDGAPAAGADPTPERGIIWLQASGAGTATLYFY